MKGQRKTQNPCQRCALHLDRCICAFIPKLDLKTKLSLVIHSKELKRTTNTGTLAVESILSAKTFIRGKPNEPLDANSLLVPGYRSVLFYPSTDAIELNQDFLNQSPLPIHLIVPDGNWRQASKVHYRISEFSHLPRVMIKSETKAVDLIRAESKPNGMATLEAIAYALGIIEGEAVKNSLLELYEKKLRATLEGRGKRNALYPSDPSMPPAD